MLIPCNNDGFALLLRDGHWHNLCRKATRLLGGDRLPMTVQRVGILISTTDVIAFCNVLCCFAHAIRVNMALSLELMKRQPSVVSCRCIVRLNAASLFPSTNGARVMLSTPPATKVSPVPVWIA